VGEKVREMESRALEDLDLLAEGEADLKPDKPILHLGIRVHCQDKSLL
jgi:hypothetical protein